MRLARNDLASAASLNQSSTAGITQANLLIELQCRLCRRRDGIAVGSGKRVISMSNLSGHVDGELPPIYSSFANDPDLSELADLFASEMPGRIAELRRHFEAADWESLGRMAHQLKGAAGSYGFGPITPGAARLESAVRRHAPEEEVRQALDEVIALCAAARGAN